LIIGRHEKRAIPDAIHHINRNPFSIGLHQHPGAPHGAGADAPIRMLEDKNNFARIPGDRLPLHIYYIKTAGSRLPHFVSE
jgi:hypothetical protein